MQTGTATLLCLTVMFQGVEHMVGEFQIHVDPVSHLHLWSKLYTEGKNEQFFLNDRSESKRANMSYVVHACRVLPSTNLLVMFGGDVLAFSSKTFPGVGCWLI